VRWIFISHDDIDHAGNLAVLMELCPKAIVLTSWFAVGRMISTDGIDLPMHRIRFVNDGDEVDIGDRKLRALLPPIFDNPTTRGVYDPSTGFYWASDCFGAPVPGFVPEADDVPAADWREGFLMLHRMLSPWHTMLDHRRYGAAVLELGRDAGIDLAERWILTPLGISAIAGLVGLLLVAARRRA